MRRDLALRSDQGGALFAKGNEANSPRLIRMGEMEIHCNNALT